jgi:hypothetical protein
MEVSLGCCLRAVCFVRAVIYNNNKSQLKLILISITVELQEILSKFERNRASPQAGALIALGNLKK